MSAERTRLGLRMLKQSRTETRMQSQSQSQSQSMMQKPMNSQMNLVMRSRFPTLRLMHSRRSLLSSMHSPKQRRWRSVRRRSPLLGYRSRYRGSLHLQASSFRQSRRTAE